MQSANNHLNQDTQATTNLKVDFIRHNYYFIQWDKSLRHDKQHNNPQCISELIPLQKAKEYLNLIHQLSPKYMHGAFKIACSTQVANQYRIVIVLNNLSLKKLTTYELQMQMAFLNNTHCPPDQIWNTCPNSAKGFAKQWEMGMHASTDIKLCLKAPSIKYLDLCGSEYANGLPIQQWLKSTFDKNAILQGFSPSLISLFSNTLRSLDGKYSCYFYFEPYDLASIAILSLARKQYEDQMGPHVQNVATSVFDMYLPNDTGKYIGFFMNAAAAGKLALTCVKASIAGTRLKDAHEKVMTSKYRR